MKMKKISKGLYYTYIFEYSKYYLHRIFFLKPITFFEVGISDIKKTMPNFNENFILTYILDQTSLEDKILRALQFIHRFRKLLIAWAPHGSLNW